MLGQAEDAAPGDPFVDGLRRRYNDLQDERQRVGDEILALDEQTADQPASITGRTWICWSACRISRPTSHKFLMI